MKRLGLLIGGVLLGMLAAAQTTVTIPAQTVTVTIPAQTITIPAASAPVVSTPAAATSYGYTNGVFYWAGDFSYNASINYADTIGMQGGKDIAVSLTGQWGAWQPYMCSAAGVPVKGCVALFSYSTVGYTKLTFQLKPTVANQKWTVFFVGVGDVALPSSCTVDPTKYGPAPVVGVWATYTIPLSVLCVANANVYKFDIQDQTGLSSNVWYAYNVGFAP